MSQPNFHLFLLLLKLAVGQSSSSSSQVRHEASGALFTVTKAPAANTKPGVFKKKQLSKQLGPLLGRSSGEEDDTSWCSLYLLGRLALLVTIVCGAVGGIVMIAAGNR